MKRKRFRLWSGLVLLASSLATLTGCHRFAYQELDPALRMAAVDEQKPTRTTRWSTAWGLSGVKLWTPVECADEAHPGDCVHQLPLCHPNGPGRVLVKYKWYSPLVLVGTLGFAVPMEIQVFCRTTCPCDTVGTGP